MNKAGKIPDLYNEAVDVVHPNSAGLEIDDDSLDNAEAVTTNPPPQGEDPSIPLIKSLKENHIPPLNVRV